MYGAILGDIIGSPFEFDRGDKTKEFDLFSKDCDFTDDSVMTIAVGEALLAVGKEATVKEIEEAVVTNMQDEAGKKIQRINSNRETEIPYRSENDGSRLLPPADTIA